MEIEMPEYESWEEDRKHVATLNARLKESIKHLTRVDYTMRENKFVLDAHDISFSTQEESNKRERQLRLKGQ
jgi:hypothetical protein